MTNCGCKIVCPEGATELMNIQYCPLHAAALDLLYDAKVNARWFDSQGYEMEARNIRRLIAKAEGKNE